MGKLDKDLGGRKPIVDIPPKREVKRKIKEESIVENYRRFIFFVGIVIMLGLLAIFLLPFNNVYYKSSTSKLISGGGGVAGGGGILGGEQSETKLESNHEFNEIEFLDCTGNYTIKDKIKCVGNCLDKCTNFFRFLCINYEEKINKIIEKSDNHIKNFCSNIDLNKIKYPIYLSGISIDIKDSNSYFLFDEYKACIKENKIKEDSPITINIYLNKLPFNELNIDLCKFCVIYIIVDEKIDKTIKFSNIYFSSIFFNFKKINAQYSIQKPIIIRDSKCDYINFKHFIPKVDSTTLLELYDSSIELVFKPLDSQSYITFKDYLAKGDKNSKILFKIDVSNLNYAEIYFSDGNLFNDDINWVFLGFGKNYLENFLVDNKRVYPIYLIFGNKFVKRVKNNLDKKFIKVIPLYKFSDRKIVLAKNLEIIFQKPTVYLSYIPLDYLKLKLRSEESTLFLNLPDDFARFSSINIEICGSISKINQISCNNKVRYNIYINITNLKEINKISRCNVVKIKNTYEKLSINEIINSTIYFENPKLKELDFRKCVDRSILYGNNVVKRAVDKYCSLNKECGNDCLYFPIGKIRETCERGYKYVNYKDFSLCLYVKPKYDSVDIYSTPKIPIVFSFKNIVVRDNIDEIITKVNCTNKEYKIDVWNKQKGIVSNFMKEISIDLSNNKDECSVIIEGYTNNKLVFSKKYFEIKLDKIVYVKEGKIILFNKELMNYLKTFNNYIVLVFNTSEAKNIYFIYSNNLNCQKNCRLERILIEQIYYNNLLNDFNKILLLNVSNSFINNLRYILIGGNLEIISKEFTFKLQNIDNLDVKYIEEFNTNDIESTNPNYSNLERCISGISTNSLFKGIRCEVFLKVPKYIKYNNIKVIPLCLLIVGRAANVIGDIFEKYLNLYLYSSSSKSETFSFNLFSRIYSYDSENKERELEIYLTQNNDRFFIGMVKSYESSRYLDFINLLSFYGNYIMSIFISNGNIYFTKNYFIPFYLKKSIYVNKISIGGVEDKLYGLLAYISIFPCVVISKNSPYISTKNVENSYIIRVHVE